MIDAMTVPTPDHFSASQVTTYTTCPRKYCYQYVLKVPVLVTPAPLLIGKRVHEAIAANGEGVDTVEQAMVARARRHLATWPERPIFETSYDDPANPGRMRGEVCGWPFVGILDVHWEEPPIAVDWKTGNYNPHYSSTLETQAYIYGELYRATYGHPLEEMAFVFLKTGDHHYAKSLAPGQSRTSAERRVTRALDGIHAREYGKKPSRLCQYCEHNHICLMECGFQ